MGLSSKQVSSDVQDWNQGLLQSGDHTNSEKPPMKRKHQQQNQQQSAEQLNCPRCDSTNTKFCYYNNYNKSQPRYFCKACKRHWTKGGMLRNVPVGGGRKNKRLKTSPTAAHTIPLRTTKLAATTNLLAPSFGEKSSHIELGVMGPQSLLQDSTFSNTLEFSIDMKSSKASDINGMFGGSSAQSYTQNNHLQFPYLSFGSLNESFPSTIASSGYISDLYGQNSGESSALEEPVMAALDGSLSCSSLNEQPWPSTEIRSNWGWEDIDKFVISDIAVPWDDSEIN